MSYLPVSIFPRNVASDIFTSGFTEIPHFKRPSKGGNVVVTVVGDMVTTIDDVTSGRVAGGKTSVDLIDKMVVIVVGGITNVFVV